MSKVIPREQLSEYRRWQVNDFDRGAHRAPLPSEAPTAAPSETESIIESGEPVDTPVPLPTAEEIEQIHEQARREGYDAGFAEGQQQAKEAADAALAVEMAKIQALTANFQQALSEVDQVLAEQVLDLALEVAAQVLRNALPVKRDFLIPVIKEAMQALPLHHGNITLALHPDDVELLRDRVAELGIPGGIHLVADRSIEAGGCLLKAGQSEVDASLPVRWKRVLESLGVESEQWLIR